VAGEDTQHAQHGTGCGVHAETGVKKNTQS
jgi:hypothetical protein